MRNGFSGYLWSDILVNSPFSLLLAEYGPKLVVMDRFAHYPSNMDTQSLREVAFSTSMDPPKYDHCRFAFVKSQLWWIILVDPKTSQGLWMWTHCKQSHIGTPVAQCMVYDVTHCVIRLVEDNPDRQQDWLSNRPASLY